MQISARDMYIYGLVFHRVSYSHWLTEGFLSRLVASERTRVFDSMVPAILFKLENSEVLCPDDQSCWRQDLWH